MAICKYCNKTTWSSDICLSCYQKRIIKSQKLSKIAKTALRDSHGRFSKLPKQFKVNFIDSSINGRLERIENRLDVHAKQIRDLQLIVQKQEK